MRTAAAFLAVLLAFIGVLQVQQQTNESGWGLLAQSGLSAVGDDEKRALESAIDLIGNPVGFEVTGFSSDPLVIGLACDAPPETAEMQVDQALLDAGWSREPASQQGLLAYGRGGQPVQWEGRDVTFALVAVSEVDSGSSLVVEVG